MTLRNRTRKKRLEGKVRRISREIEQIESLVYEGHMGIATATTFHCSKKGITPYVG